MPRSVYIAVALIAGCAKMGPPTGGEVDRAAPTVIRSIPAADAVRVPTDQLIEIEFSETMDQGRTEDAVFVSPAAGARHGWRGRRMTLELAGGMQVDRTYVVTVGTDARDLRGNRLERSHTFAFATGERLNRGRLHGAVVEEGEPAADAYVWAYDMRRFDGRIGRDEPEYQTQTGRDGTYELQRLSQGTYRVVAFTDANRNGRYDGGRERLALPARDHDLAEDEELGVSALVLAQRGTAELTLERVQVIDAQRLLLRFSRPVPVQDLEVSLTGLRVDEIYAIPTDASRVYVVTSPQESGGRYQLSVAVAGEAIRWREPVRGSRRQDRKAPELVSQYPMAYAVEGDSVRLVFSEPLKEPPGPGFWVADGSTQSPEGSWHRRGGVVFAFAPSVPLTAGAHRLRGRLTQLQDRAGLALADSFVVLEFEVLARDALATISGTVVGGQGGPVAVSAEREDGRRLVRVLADSLGAYTVAGLLPGKVKLSAFEDANGNGEPDAGRLEPYEAAEAYGRHEDAVSVAPGDVIEGVNIELDGGRTSPSSSSLPEP